MSIPTTRRIVSVNKDDHSLSINTEAMPSPAANEVLIKVAAAGINRPDLMQRYGLYPPASACLSQRALVFATLPPYPRLFSRFGTTCFSAAI